MEKWTHFDEQGNARMVEVSAKPKTLRTAVAAGEVQINAETYGLIQSGGCKKGDVLTVAQIAGIMAAKHTPDWIPLCHPILLSGVRVELSLEEAPYRVEIRATVSCSGATGVEMEALTAVSAAALTIYDMCKAVQRDMVIDRIRLLHKSGGASGTYERKAEDQ